MKRTIFIVIGIPVALGAFLFGVRLFHLGPLGIRPGDDIFLAQLLFTNGPQFFVIGHRTQFLTEPYEVTLYKVEPDHKTFSYYLAFEDSYWWACSIRSNSVSGDVEIRADGCLTARYIPGKDLVISDAYKVPIPARKAEYGQLQLLLALSKR
jgi:hypothetical protein